jgi:hypothetical protein
LVAAAEKEADLRPGLQQGKGVMAIVGIEDREAKGLEHGNRGRVGHGIVLDYQHRRLGHQLNSSASALQS